MLAKPFIFFFTFILTMANFIFLLLPISLILFPIILLFWDFFAAVKIDLFWLFMALVSFSTLLYMFFDMLFGYTVKKLNKNAQKFETMTAIPRHSEIVKKFNYLKSRFNVRNVELFILQTDLVNAFAIGGARSQSISITMGLIFEIHRKCVNEEQYVQAISGIIGHELSHLSNKDYLPGLLASSNDTVIRHISKFIRFILLLFATFTRIIPFVGFAVRNLIYRIYNLMAWLSRVFYNNAFNPIYAFVQKWFSRSIEYRCDKESAYAVGGNAMVSGLEALGKGAYFSIFSTHPKTKHRINHVKSIKRKPGIIRPSFINSLANFASMLFVVLVMYFSFFTVDLDYVEYNYIKEVKNPTIYNYRVIRDKVMWLYYDNIRSFY